MRLTIDTLLAAASVPFLAAITVPAELSALIDMAHPGTPEPIQILIRAVIIGVASRILYMVNPNPIQTTSVSQTVTAPTASAPATETTKVTSAVTQSSHDSTPFVVEEKADSVYERVMGTATNAGDVK